MDVKEGERGGKGSPHDERAEFLRRASYDETL